MNKVKRIIDLIVLSLLVISLKPVIEIGMQTEFKNDAAAHVCTLSEVSGNTGSQQEVCNTLQLGNPSEELVGAQKKVQIIQRKLEEKKVHISSRIMSTWS